MGDLWGEEGFGGSGFGGESFGGEDDWDTGDESLTSDVEDGLDASGPEDRDEADADVDGSE